MDGHDIMGLTAILSTMVGLPLVIACWSLGKRYFRIIERRAEIQQQDLAITERRLVLEERERELEIYKLELEIRQLEANAPLNSDDNQQQQLRSNER
jgi:hypothetical protein